MSDDGMSRILAALAMRCARFGWFQKIIAFTASN